MSTFSRRLVPTLLVPLVGCHELFHDDDHHGASNTAPVVTVLEPSVLTEVAPGAAVEIRWIDEDPDDQAATTLVGILQGAAREQLLEVILLSAAPEADGEVQSFSWTPAGIPAGDWIVEARTSDGRASAVAQAPGIVRVLPPEIGSAITAGGTARVVPADAKGAADGGAWIVGQLEAVAPGSNAAFGDGAVSLDVIGSSELYLARYGGDGSFAWATASQGTAFARGGGGASPSGVSSARVAAHSDGEVSASFRFTGTLVLGAGTPTETRLSVAPGSFPGGAIARFSDADGSLLWAQQVPGVFSPTPVGNLAAGGLAAAGDLVFAPVLFAAGRPDETVLDGAAGPSWVAAWDAEGSLRWVRHVAGYDAGFNGSTTDLFGCEPTRDGGAVVAGSFTGPLFFGAGGTNVVARTAVGDALFLAAFDAAGDLTWVRTVEPSSAAVSLRGLRLIHEGVGGGYALLALLEDGPATFGPGEPNETVVAPALLADERTSVVATFGEDGSLLWARATTLGADPFDLGAALTAFSDGAVVVGGTLAGDPLLVGAGEPGEVLLTLPFGASRNLLLARYGSDASLAWARLDGGAGSVVATASALAPKDNLWLAGTFLGGENGDPALGTEREAPIGLAPYLEAGMFAAPFDGQGRLLGP